MKLIQENPYRIAGLLSNTSEKELLRQKSKIKRFSEVGKTITSEYDFPFLIPITRTEEKIEKAFSDIEQNQNRVNHSLFWFINVTPIDNTAIQHLINGNKEKAFEIWEKLIEYKKLSVRNFSAFNNIGTLYLLDDSKDKLKQGITSKIKLLESDYFKNFAQTVADETFTIDNDKEIQIFINEVLSELNSRYSTNQLIDLFSDCNDSAKKYISNKFTEEPIHNIEKQVEKAKENRIKNNLNALEYGNDLYKNTKEDLSLLKSLLGSNNLQYKLLTDNVAKEILQCSIDYFNENQEQNSTKDYLEEAMKLAKLAQNVAINPITKDRIKENIKTLEGMKDREINEAIIFLKLIKEAFERNKSEIMTEVRRQELTLGFGQSINYSKVDDLINDSINWDKVVGEIERIIPPQNINKIKNSPDSSKISEYKTLINFLFGKLSYSLKRRVEYLKYWEAQEEKIHTRKSIDTENTTKTYVYVPTNSSKNTKKNDNENNLEWIYWIVMIIVAIILEYLLFETFWIIGIIIGLIILSAIR